MINRKINNKKILSFLVIMTMLLPLIALPFSPMLSFFISLLALVLFSNYNNQILRICFSVLGYFSLAIIYWSRSYKEELAMDLSIYYDVFNAISNGYFTQMLLFFGKGVEGGLVVLYKIYYDTLGKLTPYHLAFINMMLCGLGSLFWLEKYAMKTLSYKYKGYCVFFFILFFMIQMSGFLQRQALATTILLFALSQGKKKNFYILTALATFFHLTSLPLAFLFRYLLTAEISQKKILKISIALVLFRVIFPIFAMYASKTSIVGAEKLVHFTAAEFSIASGRFAVLIIFLLLIHLFLYKKIDYQYKNFVIICCIFYIVFLGIPLFSERVFFILLYIYGFNLFMAIYKHYLRLTMLFGFLYLTIFVIEKMNYLRILFDPFWQRYPMFDTQPFYYFNF